MSIRFNLVKMVMQLIGVKKISALPKNALLAAAQNRNRKRNLKSRKNVRYTEITILNRYRCLKVETQPCPSKRALLFIFGGGYILVPDDGDLKLAEKLGKYSGRDVWFPCYPLCTENSVKEAYEMVYATYKKMLEEYHPEEIALLGFSSGGALALGICLHNNVQKQPLPMPGLIIVSSPGCVPVSIEEKQKMAELSKKDILIDPSFIVTIQEIMEHGMPVPDYMISAVSGNFTNFPMTHFYYGSDEILYAEAPYFARAYEKYKIPYEMHIGKGMCHCYPALPFYPEGKQAQQEIIQLLKN